MADDLKTAANVTAIEKFKNSNVTVDELRTAIFAPVMKLSGNSKTKTELKDKGKLTRETSWGKVTIEKTVLIQLHRNLLDCIFAHNDGIFTTDTKTIIVKFSANNVLKHYSVTDSETRNTSWLETKLTDMMTAVISVAYKNNDKFKFKMIETVRYIEAEKSFQIEFSKDYVKFFESKITIDYSEYLDDILELKSPVLQAIVRLYLTHEKTFCMSIYDNNSSSKSSGILESIGYPIESDRNRQRAIKEIKDNAQKLEKFGIYLSDKKKNPLISYKKTLDIRFLPKGTREKYLSLPKDEKEAFLRLIEYKNELIQYGDKKYSMENFELDDDNTVILYLKDIEKEESDEELKMSFKNKNSIEVEKIIIKSLVK